MAKIVVGLYQDIAAAQETAAALVADGFRRENISVVANQQDAATVEAQGTGESADTLSHAGAGLGIGAALGGLAGLLVGLGTMAIPGVGIALIAGPLLTLISGASLGGVAGGLIGILVDMGIPAHEAHGYAEGVRRGNAVLLAQASDEEAERVAAIMERLRPLDLDTLSAHWRQAGWNGFNPELSPLSEDELADERARAISPPLVAGAESGAAAVERSLIRIHGAELTAEIEEAPPGEAPPGEAPLAAPGAEQPAARPQTPDAKLRETTIEQGLRPAVGPGSGEQPSMPPRPADRTPAGQRPHRP